jgi:4-amino-4-deoxy-L-arabinose transferase-like glycosyltransferase
MIVTPLQDRLEASTAKRKSQRSAILTLLGLWLLLFVAALFTPPLLDDADSTHANAARAMSISGDWVTLHVNGIRYLEKAPLPYWLVALSFRIFGFNSFATHFPQALVVLLLALLGYRWADEAYGTRAAFYTGLATLTSTGIFLFTRIFIPEVILSLLLCTSLYCLLQTLALESERSSSSEAVPASFYPYAMWTALALAVLTKGLVALVFFFGAAAAYLFLTSEFKQWRALRPFSGLLLFLAIASPWHILAGIRNTGGMNGHGFFWFYFVNEHVLRFLGKRYPKDYNKLPNYLFWSLHIVWLFPWSLFAGLLLRQADRYRNLLRASTFSRRTALLLVLFSALVLIFFAISTNQEYYTFPAYLPLLMLICAGLARAEETYNIDRSARGWIITGHVIFTVIGITAASALALGLWTSRNLPFVPDIGELLAHRGVGNYTLSMSHLFDLTGPSFAALRLPAALAAFALALGPMNAWLLRAKRRHVEATVTIGATSAVFLVAAHIALVRFGPMLSSQNLAARILELKASDQIAPNSQIILFGDQSYGSSILFYLNQPLDRPALLVNGRSSSLLFGSTFPDAPNIFIDSQQLRSIWGTGPRKILFVPLERRDDADRLLGDNKVLLKETSGKALFTDRPLETRGQVDHRD